MIESKKNLILLLNYIGPKCKCFEYGLCKFIGARDKNRSLRKYLILCLRSPNGDIEDLISYPVPRASDEYTQLTPLFTERLKNVISDVASFV